MKYKISGYTTSRNALTMVYPFTESILSVLEFADEVIVVDTSKTTSKTISDPQEGTLEQLLELSKRDSRVKIYHTEEFDWKAPNHGIFDGKTKALARSKCTGDFLFQFDLDEIVHLNDAKKIRPLIEKLNYLRECPVLALPVIEYWGNSIPTTKDGLNVKSGKVRMDINPWKWRISRNLPHITHGIPIHLRTTINELDYSLPGSDGCNLISITTGKDVPFISFVTDQDERLRQMALKENPKLVPVYEKWFNKIIEELPGVHHYSWISIERKIKQYREFWTGFWQSLYGITKDERTNPFFPGLLWSEVTNEMIKEKAKELETLTGGHIFHSPFSPSKLTPWIQINRDHPEIIKEWILNLSKEEGNVNK